MLRSIMTAAALVASTAMAAPAAEVTTGADIVLFGGASSSGFSGGDKTLLGDGTRNAGTAGLSFMLRVNQDYGFQADIRLTQKGGEGRIDITDYTGVNNGPTIVGEGTTRLTYVEIPLMLAAHLATGEKHYLRAYGGPSFNILASASFEGEIEGQQQNVDIKEGVATFEYAIAIGGGWTYDAGKASVWIDGRWSLGLSSIDDTGKDRDITNQSWEFALGVGLPLARE
jgi:opacity protein-like surface antigen